MSIKEQVMGVTIGDQEQYFVKKFTPIVTKEERRYRIERRSQDEIPFESFTCTHTMADGIGNVTELDADQGLCSVRAVLRGVERELQNVRVWDDRIVKVGERVMVTEHLNVSGQIELVATKERILKQDFNFFNFGWETPQGRRVLTVDIYTGEFFEQEQGKGK